MMKSYSLCYCNKANCSLTKGVQASLNCRSSLVCAVIKKFHEMIQFHTNLQIQLIIKNKTCVADKWRLQCSNCNSEHNFSHEGDFIVYLPESNPYWRVVATIQQDANAHKLFHMISEQMPICYCSGGGKNPHCSPQISYYSKY